MENAGDVSLGYRNLRFMAAGRWESSLVLFNISSERKREGRVGVRLGSYLRTPSASTTTTQTGRVTLGSNIALSTFLTVSVPKFVWMCAILNTGTSPQLWTQPGVACKQFASGPIRRGDDFFALGLAVVTGG